MGSASPLQDMMAKEGAVDAVRNQNKMNGHAEFGSQGREGFLLVCDIWTPFLKRCPHLFAD